MIELIKKLFGYCPYCNRWFQFGVKSRKIVTPYSKQKIRYHVSCKSCFNDLEYDSQKTWEEVYKSMKLKNRWA